MLKEQNFRMTRQRKVILEELKKVKTHPSADEIYTIVRRRLPRISLGTVYRNLEILAGLGEIQKLELGGAQKRFDGNPQPHYHLRCLYCNWIVDVPAPPFKSIKNIEKELSGLTDYKILGHRLEFIGICPGCSASNQLSRSNL